ASSWSGIWLLRLSLIPTSLTASPMAGANPTRSPREPSALDAVGRERAATATASTATLRIIIDSWFRGNRRDADCRIVRSVRNDEFVRHRAAAENDSAVDLAIDGREARCDAPGFC